MKIVVLVKYVPESAEEWKFTSDNSLDREAMDGRLSELDEYAVEQATRLAESGLDAEITHLTVGPAAAKDGLLKALAIGGDKGVHVVDDGMQGSDALSTSLVLAKAIEAIGYDLVLTGMASTDAEMSVLPSMIADRLGANQATFAKSIAVEGDTVKITRDSAAAELDVQASLPAVVSVTDATGEVRYPAFRQIMMAKKKPIQAMSLADIGVDPSAVGAGAAAIKVRSIENAPPRAAGVVVTDDGTGASQIADYLAGRGLI